MIDSDRRLLVGAYIPGRSCSVGMVNGHCDGVAKEERLYGYTFLDHVFGH